MKQRYAHKCVTQWEAVLQLEQEGWEVVGLCQVGLDRLREASLIAWTLKRPVEEEKP